MDQLVSNKCEYYYAKKEYLQALKIIKTILTEYKFDPKQKLQKDQQ